MPTPYISAEMLVASPVSVSFSDIPVVNSTEAEQLAAAVQLCWQATSRVDTYCHQVLRSTADTEYFQGPGLPRCNVNRDTGVGELQVRRWPVTEVLAIQISSSRAFPRVYTPVPAGQWDIHRPLTFSGDSAAPTAPDGGWGIDVAPGWIHGRCGRGMQRVQVSYVNGWPHASLTEDAAQGDDILHVDDVTGWAGAAGMAYGGAATEQVSVTAVTSNSPLVLPNGAGTGLTGLGAITLASPLANGHDAGTIVSALPAAVIEASAYAAAIQALEGGVDSVTVQTINGAHTASGSSGVAEIQGLMEGLLGFFRRIA